MNNLNFRENAILEYLNNQHTLDNLNLHDKYIDDLKIFLSKYKSDEDLLRSGGLPIDLLDRLAHGFSENDIKSIKNHRNL